MPLASKLSSLPFPYLKCYSSDKQDEVMEGKTLIEWGRWNESISIQFKISGSVSPKIETLASLGTMGPIVKTCFFLIKNISVEVVWQALHYKTGCVI